MWRRKLRRAFERSGARAPGAAVGWTVVVILMLVGPATRLGLYPAGDPSEVRVEATLAREELALGPTVTSASDLAPTITGLESTLTPIEPEQDLIGPTVPAETPATQVISTTAAATAAAPTSQSTTVSSATTEAPTTTAPTTGGPTGAAPTTTTEASTATTAAPTTGGSTRAAPTTATPSTAIPTTTPTTATPFTTTPTTAPSTTQTRNPNFAVGDAYELESGQKENLRVLSNDGDQGLLDRGTLEIIVAPSHAQGFGVQGNHIRYQSDGDYAGTDSLRYRICTIDGVCAVATVTIQVIDD